MNIMQGDQYYLAIEVSVNDEPIVDVSSISDMEICLGNLKKRMSDGDILFSTPDNAFIFLISQEEAFALPAVSQKMQVRIKFTNGDVVGESLGTINIRSSMSKNVI